MIDVLAGEPQFADHLLPVYQALNEPGDFLVSAPMLLREQSRWGPITSDVTDPTRPVVVASYGDVKRARRQGRTSLVRIEHGAGQNYGTGHGSYAGGKDHGDVGLFLMPNEYSAALWRKAYPAAQVEVIGSPRLDTLPKREPGPLTICVSFHWDCYLVPETVSAFAHYRGVLPDLVDHYNVIGHAHPRAAPIYERRYRRLRIEYVRTFDEVCRRADLYICDNSSSLFEFATTGRPVVVLNAPGYRRDVNHGLRFWEAANVGVQVDHSGDLMAGVAKALEDKPAQRRAREAALKLVYAYRSGAAQRAADIIEAWASGEQQRAA